MRFHVGVSFRLKTIKKYLIPILLGILAYFGFNGIFANAQTNNNTYYEYLAKCDCCNHFYLKCQKCGTLIHVDCDCINDSSDYSNSLVNDYQQRFCT